MSEKGFAFVPNPGTDLTKKVADDENRPNDDRKKTIAEMSFAEQVRLARAKNPYFDSGGGAFW